MFEDMEKKGIVFELQWKTRTLVSSGEEFASIGIWEVDDSSLDWSNFKPYLCQTLGNVENLAISYVDSDGDLIPIESDCEFQEALKYARRKATMGQKLILKVEKLDSHSASSGGVELSSSPIYIKSSNFIKERFKIHTNNVDDHNPFHPSTSEAPIRIGNLSCKVKSKSKAKDISCPMQSCDSPPLWFKKYMQKMKSEIIYEVTANVTSQVKKVIEEQGSKGKPYIYAPGLHSPPDFTDAWLVAKTKKKVADDDSSDGAHKVEIKDSKILKRIEKLHRREKKLDHKKEKLEQKAKKIAERKDREFLSKLRLERAGCKRAHNDSLSHKHKEPEKVSILRTKLKQHEFDEAQVVPPQEWEEPVLAFTVSTSDKRTMSVKRATKFTKVWKVVNSGNVPWTDETEIKLSWGNAGLEPEALTLKCPHLSPGEEGDVCINFNAPDFPGLFESHWHFFHKNVRFGSSISCIISVDLISNAEYEAKSEQKESSLSSAEFCVIPNSKFAVEGDNEKLVVNEAQNGSSSVTEEAAISLPLEKILPKIKSFASASVPWESLDDRDEVADKEIIEDIEKRKETEFESISTDDLSGSVASLGSESEDNFVVVPMPPCFRFDVPLDLGIISTKEESVVTKDETASPNHQQSKSPQKSIENIAIASISSGLPIQEQSEVSCDTGEVISMPIPLPEMPLVTQMRELDVSELRKETTPPRQSPKPVLPPPLQPTPAPATQPRPSASTQSNSPPPIERVTINSSASPRGSPKNSRGPPSPVNIPTAPPRYQHLPRPIDLMPPVITEVWNEAMNATTSALNTAFSVLDTVIGPSVSNGHVYNRTPEQQEKPMEPKMIEDLSQLATMGFCNLELNEALLRVHNHNISEVVELLLSRESDN